MADAMLTDAFKDSTIASPMKAKVVHGMLGRIVERTWRRTIFTPMDGVDRFVLSQLPPLFDLWLGPWLQLFRVSRHVGTLPPPATKVKRYLVNFVANPEPPCRLSESPKEIYNNMPGLRLHHPTLYDTVLMVPHPGGGTINRLPKDYKITLDNNGDTIVSKTVWEGLKECKGYGFDHQLVYVNEIDNPPPQGVGFQPLTELPNVERVGMTREGTPSFIEKMKREGIIPKGVTPKVTRHEIVPNDDDK